MEPKVPWYKKEVWLVGIKLTFLQMLIFFILWNFFLCFIWPLIIGSSFFTFTWLCAITFLLTATVLRMLVFVFVLLQFIYKKSIGAICNVILWLCAFAVIFVYHWFVPMGWMKFFNCFIVNLFSAYLIQRFVIETTKFNEDDSDMKVGF